MLLAAVLTVGCAAGLFTTGLVVNPVFLTVEVLLQALISRVDTASAKGRAINERDFEDTVDMIRGDS